MLHSFQSSDGNSPLASLVFDRAGNLYGTAWMGGGFRGGTVFHLMPPSSAGGEWTEATLHNFGHGHDGSEPSGGLIFGQDGALYGTTMTGGGQFTNKCELDGYAWTCGVVFRVEP